jgi:DNA-binding transcriptional regulator Cro
MTKEKAIKLAGSVIKLAKLLDIERQAIYNWKKIPPLRVYQLKELKPEWFRL